MQRVVHYTVVGRRFFILLVKPNRCRHTVKYLRAPAQQVMLAVYTGGSLAT
jgi:hypothetical protein